MDDILISLSQPYWICFSNCHVANHHFLQEFIFWKGTTNLRRVSMDPSMFFLCWDGSSRQNLGKNFFLPFYCRTIPSTDIFSVSDEWRWAILMNVMQCIFIFTNKASHGIRPTYQISSLWLSNLSLGGNK